MKKIYTLLSFVFILGSSFLFTHKALADNVILEQTNDSDIAVGGWDFSFVFQFFHTSSTTPISSVQIKVANNGVDYEGCRITNGWSMRLHTTSNFTFAQSNETYMFSSPEMTTYTFTFDTQIPANQIIYFSVDGLDSFCQLPYWPQQNLNFAGSLDNPLPLDDSYAFNNQAGPTSVRVPDFDMWFRILSKDPDSTLTPVVIVPGILGSAQKNGVWVLDPILHTYDNLVDTLKANGYESDKTLFLFPYDWRQSNIDTAIQLKQKIDSIKQICNCSKVDIVAHSMGGLVARQYAESESYENDIDKLVFLGTPHLGAPEAYLTWEGGEIKPGLFSSLEKFFLTNQGKKEGYKSLFDYVRQKPIASVEQLLPIFDYLQKDSTSLLTYPDGYPVNSFLELLDNRVTNLSGINVVNITGLQPSNNTIQVIDIKESNSELLWQHGQPDSSAPNGGIILGAGDGTVPSRSSDIFPNGFIINGPDHQGLPTAAEGNVLDALEGLSNHTLVHKKHPINAALVIKLLSPVDMEVIAPDGTRIGKNFQDNTEYNEIPDAFYSGFGTDDEYITIPDPMDGDYKIITQGTGDGEYTIASALVSDTQDLEQDYDGFTAPGLIENIDLNLSSGTVQVLPEDTTPPTISIISPSQKNYTHDESLNINVFTTDDTAVFSTDIKLDTLNVSNNTTIDLANLTLGNHMLTVDAKDYAGNESTLSVLFTVVASKNSTLQDLDKAFQLGWIENAGTYNSLSQKLQNQDILYSFINELNAQLNKHINNQAYELLTNDINWLK